MAEQDPYAATAVQQSPTADPYAATAVAAAKPTKAPAATPRSLTQKVSDFIDEKLPYKSAADIDAQKYPDQFSHTAAKVVRPLANVVTRAIRDVGHIPEAIAYSHPIDNARQAVEDNLHPLAAMRRHAADVQAEAATANHPYDPTSRTGYLAPGQAVPKPTEQDVTDLAGDAMAQIALAEVGGRALKGAAVATRMGADLVTGKATPSGLRRTAQKITGVGTKAVSDVVAKAAEDTAGKDAAVAAGNKELEEQRTRRGQIQQRVEQRTGALQAKQQTIKTAEKAKNDARWEAVRSKTAGHETPLQPIKDVVAIAQKSADPDTSRIFSTILKEEDGAQLPTLHVDNNPVNPGDGRLYDIAYEATFGTPVPLQQEATGGVGYDRLQRWYSWLGDQRYGRQWNGTTYKALGAVQNSIDQAMQDIAERAGAKPELAEARDSHQHFMEAFSDSPDNAMSNADKNLQEANPEAYRRKREDARTGMIAHYDPSYKSDFDTLRGDHDTLKAFPSEDAIRNKVQAPPDAPEISLKETREELLRRATKRWSDISQYKLRRIGVSSIGGLVALAGGGSGETAGLTVSALYGMSEFAPNMVSGILNKPAVAEWLTKPTPEDLETLRNIPHRDRVRITDAMASIAEEEARAGRPVKVAPEVQKLIGARGMMRVNAARRLVPGTAGDAKARAAQVAGGADPTIDDPTHDSTFIGPATDLPDDKE